MPVGVISNRPMSSWPERPPVIYVPTYSERAESCAQTAEACEQPVVVFSTHGSDIPHQIADTREEALEYALRETFSTFLQFVLDNSKTKSVGVAGGSAGAAKIGYGLRQTGGMGIDRLAVWEPVGLSNWAGSGVKTSGARFLAELIWAGRRISPFQRGFITQIMGQILEASEDIRAGIFMEEMKTANRCDFAAEFVAHAKRGHQVLVLAGLRDSLIQPSDIVKALTRADQLPKNSRLSSDSTVNMEFADGNLHLSQIPGLQHLSSVLPAGRKATLEVIEFATLYANA